MPKKTATKRLEEWRRGDDMRQWTIGQDSQAEHERPSSWRRTVGEPDVCVGLIILRWTKKSNRLMNERWYHGYGQTIEEAIDEALSKAKEGGDA